jgi:hypothetical protein
LTKWLDKAQATIPNLSLDNIGEQFDRFVAFAQGRILAVLKSDALDNVGEAIAMGINGLTGAIVAVVGGPESTSIVGQAFTVLLRELGDVLANLSWESWAMVGAAVLGPGIIGAIATMAAGFAAPFLAAVAGAPLVLAAGVGLSLGLLAKVVIERWDEITAIASGFFRDIAQTFRGGAEIAIGVLTGNLGLIQDGMRNLVDGVMGWINQARDAWAIATGGTTTGQAAANRAKARSIQLLEQAKANKAKPSFDGYIPNAASGFMGLLTAAARERRAMPAGANLLVANTSETVLTREQAGAVGGALANKGGGNTFNINMTVSGAGDPDTVADRVLRLLQIQLDEHLQGSLI